jgi:predicted nuclease of restriction endonuclease-like (RecB) superfamily
MPEKPELTPAQKEFLESGSSKDKKSEEVAESDDKKADETEEVEETEETTETTKEEKPAEGEPSKTPFKSKFSFTTAEDLEKAYSNSFAEAQRLHKELEDKEARIAELESGKSEETDEDDDKSEGKKSDSEPRVDPRQVYEDQKDWEAFVESHPEIAETDENGQPTEEAKQLAAQLSDAFDFVAITKRKKFPKDYFPMRDVLQEAWDKYVKTPEGKAELKAAEAEAKRQYAAGEGGGSAPAEKKEKTPGLTEREKRTAKVYGISEEQYLKRKLEKLENN